MFFSLDSCRFTFFKNFFRILSPYEEIRHYMNHLSLDGRCLSRYYSGNMPIVVSCFYLLTSQTFLKLAPEDADVSPSAILHSKFRPLAEITSLSSSKCEALCEVCAFSPVFILESLRSWGSDPDPNNRGNKPENTRVVAGDYYYFSVSVPFPSSFLRCLCVCHYSATNWGVLQKPLTQTKISVRVGWSLYLTETPALPFFRGK